MNQPQRWHNSGPEGGFVQIPLHRDRHRADTNHVRPRRKRIGDILREHGLVSEDELAHAIEIQQERGGRLGQILLDEGILSPITLLKSLANQFGVDLVDLDDEVMDIEAVNALPPELARRHRALPLRWENDTLVVAMGNPADLFAMDDIRAAVGAPIRPVMAETAQLRGAITRWTREDITGGEPLMPEPVPEENEKEKEKERREVSTIHLRFVDAVLGRAVGEQASDVHLEPTGSGLRVRFRIDGVLRDVFTAPRGTEAGVISRLKVLAGMDIADRRIPQDGRCSYAVDGRSIDIRVATVPTIHGEAAVIRLLDTRADVRRLDDLGLLPHNLAAIRATISRPWGALLVTGPTGSGKTTTLYGALRELNDPSRNVMTVEDPVEITMEGIKQVQINPQAGLTFASALRSFLRADPDVVLIGEIRDTETATIATEASLTGHLVLSSIHTNDAASTPLRLLEMGVEPFLVASALQAVVAQRLARKLCERCRQAFEPTDEELTQLGWDRARLLDGARPTLYRGIGCRSCGDTGYRGRVALHEVLVVTDDMATTFGRRAPVEEIRALADAHGMRSLREDGLVKSSMGLTGVDELARVLA